VEDLGVDPAFWRGKRVFLTGHTGFKGSWLSLWLQSMGAEVVGYSAGVPTTPSLFELARVGEAMTSVEGDIRDLGALRDALAEHRPAVVIHMAAQPLVRRSFREPVETYETNVLGTVHVLEAVRTTPGVKLLINVTSDKCYEEQGDGRRPYREDDAKGGRDPYSNSKGCAELVTAAYRESFFSGGPTGSEETAVASVRAGNVIGGGDWAEDRLVPDIMRSVLEGRSVLIRNPDAVRPWQHVLNPLSGYLLLGQKLWEEPSFAEGWNFGPDESDVRPVRWLVDRVRSLWGNGLTWEEDPSGAQPPEASYLQLDSSKARERLGWRPGWNLDQALEGLVRWYREYQAGADMREVALNEIRAFAGP
jgi:CDP-glucose 4,6-dehydratase